MMDDSDDRWDFYPCLVDDQPASMFLNLKYEDGVPLMADTLYWVRIQMRDAAEHGMGSAAESDVLHAAEDAIVETMADDDLIYVGRLRTNGTWQLTFYGEAGCTVALTRTAGHAKLDGRAIDVGSKPDGDWSYYRTFMWPEPERRQWMLDRGVVSALQSHGDVSSHPRPVFHWAYFPTAEGAAAFTAAAARVGFLPDDQHAVDDSFGARVQRVDTTDLHHIHEVVMTLVALAEEHGGRYDGWETSIEKPDAN